MKILSGSKLVVVAMGIAAMVAGCKTNLDQSDNTITNPGSDAAAPTPDTANESKNIDEVEPGITAIAGHLTDVDTGEAVPGVFITTTPATGSVTSNSKGQWVIDATKNPNIETQAGATVTVHFSKPGYLEDSTTITVVKGTTQIADFQMKKAATDFNIEIVPDQLQFSESDFDKDGIATTEIKVRLVSSSASDKADFDTHISSAQAKWLSADPSSGTLTGSPVFVTITVDKTKLTQKVTNGQVEFIRTGATDSKTLQITVALDATPGT